MAEPIILFITGRIVERWLIVAGGMMCLWFGYRLFAITTASDSSAEVGAQSFTFKAQKIGPGIFFALFGTSLLGYVAFTKIDLSSEESRRVADAQSNIKAAATKKLEPSSEFIDKKTRYIGDRESSTPEMPLSIKAVNSLLSIWSSIPPGAKTMGIAQYEVFREAAPHLEQFQREFIDKRYGAGSFDVVKAMETECARNTERCRSYRDDEENRQKMDKIRDDLGTLLQ